MPEFQRQVSTPNVRHFTTAMLALLHTPIEIEFEVCYFSPDSVLLEIHPDLSIGHLVYTSATLS
jgi:hypothetical protein